MNNLPQDMIILEARGALEGRPRRFCKEGREIKERDGKAAVRSLTELRIGKRSVARARHHTHQLKYPTRLETQARFMEFTRGHRLRGHPEAHPKNADRRAKRD